MSDAEPIFDVAHLSHAELLTPRFDQSVRFFKDLMGLYETGRDDTSVYLRGYEESHHHSLRLTRADEPGLGHIGLRTTSRAALDRRVAEIEAMGAGIGWVDDATGYGPAYEYRSPDGHRMRIFWEIERPEVAKDQRSRLLNRPMKRPGIGVPVRRLDHLNIMCSDVAPVRDFLIRSTGARLREAVVADAGPVIGAWLSHNNINHDLALTMDMTGASGRLHHVAFYYGVPQHLNDMADLLRENEIAIEAGPGRHGITQGSFLYCFEPGGNRIELFGDEGYLIFEPDWQPVIWPERDLALGLSYYGAELPLTGAAIGTPPRPIPDPAEIMARIQGKA
ncbi:VOC family protein [Aestuariibius sp. 2305UL40-4]|uniref:VOC family protein n=1 Tax=Aestuariibius violaceus TaxID=3234132 RepID=UPI00345F01BE